MMKRFSHVLRLAMCLSVLALVLSVPTSSPAVDPGPPGGLNVNVVNTPLPVTGIVSGSVSITGTPNVGVVNAPSSPVPVRDVDNPARNAFQAVISPTFATGQKDIDDTSISVPAGKRLVVEHVSITACLPNGQKIVEAQIRNAPTGGNAFVALLVTALGAGGGGCDSPFDGFIVSQVVRFYKDSGTGGLDVHLFRDSGTDFGSVDATIVGYLVDKP